MKMSPGGMQKGGEMDAIKRTINHCATRSQQQRQQQQQ